MSGEREARGGEPPAEGHGQLRAETARFDLGPHAPVLAEALGPPPAGYRLTYLRLLARDPSTLLVVWEVNDPDAVQAGERDGWRNLLLVVRDGHGEPRLRRRLGRRGGILSLEVPGEGGVWTGELVLDGAALPPGPIARSCPVRAARHRPSGGGTPEALALPPDLDRRALVRGEPPAIPGHAPPPRGGDRPAARLLERLEIAAQAGRCEGVSRPRPLGAPGAAPPEEGAGGPPGSSWGGPGRPSGRGA